jgi:hypothetical protein
VVTSLTKHSKYNKYTNFWTEKELELVRLNYRGNIESVFTIQRMLKIYFNIDRSYHAIRHKAKDLNLTRYLGRKWSKEEESKLAELLNNYPIKNIAKRMNRTERSIRMKCNSLNIHQGIQARRDWYTQGDLVTILGVSPSTVNRWIASGTLLVSKTECSLAFKITTKCLKRFIINNTSELTGRNVDLLQIIGILCPNGISSIKDEKEVK